MYQLNGNMTRLFEEMNDKKKEILELKTDLKVKELQSIESKDDLVVRNRELEKQISD